jgi:hypothetical protein
VLATGRASRSGEMLLDVTVTGLATLQGADGSEASLNGSGRIDLTRNLNGGVRLTAAVTASLTSTAGLPMGERLRLCQAQATLSTDGTVALGGQVAIQTGAQPGSCAANSPSSALLSLSGTYRDPTNWNATVSLAR